MPRTLVEIQLEELTVNSNGDLPKDKKPVKPKAGSENNIFVATLVYPRSGAAQVVTSKGINLKDKKPHRPVGYWKKLVFKEEIQDRAILKVEVLDRDSIGKVAKFLSALFNTILTTVLGGLVKGAITHNVVGAVANFGVKKIAGAYEVGKGESLHSIGVAKVELSESAIPSTLDLDLIAPATIKVQYYDFKSPGDTKVVKKTKTLITKGKKNGKATFKLRTSTL